MFREAQCMKQFMDQGLEKEIFSISESTLQKWQKTLHTVVVIHLYCTLVAVCGPSQSVSADHRCPGHRSPMVTSLAVDGVGQHISLGSRRAT